MNLRSTARKSSGRARARRTSMKPRGGRPYRGSANGGGASSRGRDARVAGRSRRSSARGVDRKATPARREPLRAGPAAATAEAAPRWPDVGPLLKRQPWDDLIPHLLKIGADPDAVIARLRRYCELIVQWNRKVSNLISKNDEERIVPRHILESVEPAHWLKERGAKRWLDFGSGAGLPAIPLALCGIGGEWTLVESRRTKTLFLRKAVEDLEIDGVAVMHARLEDLRVDENHANSYDGFTSRATLTLGPTLALASRFIGAGGTAFLWKGSRREEEMTADKAWRESWDFDGLLGIGDGSTAVARFRRK